MSIVLCTGATFVKINSCLVARIVSFNTAGLHLLTFHFPYFRAIPVQRYPPIKFYLNQCFQVSQLLKYDGNIVITEPFFKAMLWWKCGYLQITPHETLS